MSGTATTMMLADARHALADASVRARCDAVNEPGAVAATGKRRTCAESTTRGQHVRRDMFIRSASV